jgi:ADP-heptose:LPS heptosyltransferase
MFEFPAPEVLRGIQWLGVGNKDNGIRLDLHMNGATAGGIVRDMARQTIERTRIPFEVEDDRPMIVLEKSEIEAFGRYKGWIAIDTYANNPVRLWPYAYWIRLSEALMDEGWKVLEIGGNRKRTPVEQSIPFPCTESLFGKCSIRESASVLANCALLVGSDTGSAHLAAAVGTRHVTLYAAKRPYPHEYPTSISISSPRACENRCWVRPAACLFNPTCIEEIRLETVYKAVKGALA